MNKINKNYIKERLNEQSENKIKEAYRLLQTYASYNEEIIEAIEDIYYGYLGYCESNNVPYVEEEFLDELITTINEMNERYAQLEKDLENPSDAKVLRVKVWLDGLKSKFNRIIDIPVCYRLCDLAYTAFYSFKMIGFKPFSIEIGNVTSYSRNAVEPEDIERVPLTDEVHLVHIGFEEHEIFTIYYDINHQEPWVIKGEVLGILDNEHQIDCPQVVKGKGNGVFEDHRDFFNLLVTKSKEEIIAENNLDKKTIKLLNKINMEGFQRRDCNETLDEVLTYYIDHYENDVDEDEETIDEPDMDIDF